MSEVAWDIEWEAPPIKDTWKSRLGPLMERPNEWAKVAVGPYDRISRTAWALRHKYQLPTPNEDWEFNVSKLNDELGQIHARYLGEERVTA